MTDEIPETCFSGETSIYQHIKTIDSKECGISLAARKNIQCWVAEPNISNHIWWFQQLLKRGRLNILSEIVNKFFHSFASCNIKFFQINKNYGETTLVRTNIQVIPTADFFAMCNTQTPIVSSYQKVIRATGIMKSRPAAIPSWAISIAFSRWYPIQN